MTHAFVKNDAGRRAAGFPSEFGDCVTRSFSIAAEVPFFEARRLVLEGVEQATTHDGLARYYAAQRVILLARGWCWKQVRAPGMPRVYWQPSDIPPGRLIAAVGAGWHWCAILDGVLHDSNDPTWHKRAGGRLSVFGYWFQKGTRSQPSTS